MSPAPNGQCRPPNLLVQKRANSGRHWLDWVRRPSVLNQPGPLDASLQWRCNIPSLWVPLVEPIVGSVAVAVDPHLHPPGSTVSWQRGLVALSNVAQLKIIAGAGINKVEEKEKKRNPTTTGISSTLKAPKGEDATNQLMLRKKRVCM